MKRSVCSSLQNLQPKAELELALAPTSDRLPGCDSGAHDATSRCAAGGPSERCCFGVAPQGVGAASVIGVRCRRCHSGGRSAPSSWARRVWRVLRSERAERRTEMVASCEIVLQTRARGCEASVDQPAGESPRTPDALRLGVPPPAPNFSSALQILAQSAAGRRRAMQFEPRRPVTSGPAVMVVRSGDLQSLTAGPEKWPLTW